MAMRVKKKVGQKTRELFCSGFQQWKWRLTSVILSYCIFQFGLVARGFCAKTAVSRPTRSKNYRDVARRFRLNPDSVSTHLNIANSVETMAAAILSHGLSPKDLSGNSNNSGVLAEEAGPVLRLDPIDMTAHLLHQAVHSVLMSTVEESDDDTGKQPEVDDAILKAKQDVQNAMNKAAIENAREEISAHLLRALFAMAEKRLSPLKFKQELPGLREISFDEKGWSAEDFAIEALVRGLEKISSFTGDRGGGLLAWYKVIVHHTIATYFRSLNKRRLTGGIYWRSNEDINDVDPDEITWASTSTFQNSFPESYWDRGGVHTSVAFPMAHPEDLVEANLSAKDYYLLNEYLDGTPTRELMTSKTALKLFNEGKPEADRETELTTNALNLARLRLVRDKLPILAKQLATDNWFPYALVDYFTAEQERAKAFEDAGRTAKEFNKFWGVKTMDNTHPSVIFDYLRSFIRGERDGKEIGRSVMGSDRAFNALWNTTLKQRVTELINADTLENEEIDFMKAYLRLQLEVKDPRVDAHISTINNWSACSRRSRDAVVSELLAVTPSDYKERVRDRIDADAKLDQDELDSLVVDHRRKYKARLREIVDVDVLDQDEIKLMIDYLRLSRVSKDPRIEAHVQTVESWSKSSKTLRRAAIATLFKVTPQELMLWAEPNPESKDFRKFWRVKIWEKDHYLKAFRKLRPSITGEGSAVSIADVTRGESDAIISDQIDTLKKRVRDLLDAEVLTDQDIGFMKSHLHLVLDDRDPNIKAYEKVIDNWSKSAGKQDFGVSESTRSQRSDVIATLLEVTTQELEEWLEWAHPYHPRR